MWILEWGDSTNQAGGQWNHEEHDSSDAALDAAKTKLAMGLIAHTIHSEGGVLWMSSNELLDVVEAKEAANATFDIHDDGSGMASEFLFALPLRRDVKPERSTCGKISTLARWRP